MSLYWDQSLAVGPWLDKQGFVLSCQFHWSAPGAPCQECTHRCSHEWLGPNSRSQEAGPGTGTWGHPERLWVSPELRISLRHVRHSLWVAHVTSSCGDLGSSITSASPFPSFHLISVGSWSVASGISTADTEWTGSLRDPAHPGRHRGLMAGPALTGRLQPRLSPRKLWTEGMTCPASWGRFADSRGRTGPREEPSPAVGILSQEPTSSG